MAFRKVTVGTQPKQIAPYHAKRVCITILNRAGSCCFISANQSGIIEEGFTLEVGMILSLVKADGDETRDAIWGQCETGSADLRVYESFGEE